MVGENIRNALDREPIWRKLEDRVDKTASNLRNRPSRRLEEKLPQVPNRNIGGGVGAGLVEAGIAKVLEETVGIPFGSDTEIVDTEPVDDGTMYVVNIDAPFENMAKARAFLEANTGFTSILTDELNVEEVEVLRTRPIRDTYQAEVLVVD